MTHRKVDAPPNRDMEPRKSKPGDFEPLPNTKDPLIVQPPAPSPQSPTIEPSPGTREVEPRC